MNRALECPRCHERAYISFREFKWSGERLIVEEHAECLACGNRWSVLVSTQATIDQEVNDCETGLEQQQ